MGIRKNHRTVVEAFASRIPEAESEDEQWVRDRLVEMLEAFWDPDLSNADMRRIMQQKHEDIMRRLGAVDENGEVVQDVDAYFERELRRLDEECSKMQESRMEAQEKIKRLKEECDRLKEEVERNREKLKRLEERRRMKREWTEK